MLTFTNSLPMRTPLLILGGLALVLVAYWGIKFYLTVQISKKLIDAAVPFTAPSDDSSSAVLVLGDSTAVGVGADSPEDTVAGRVNAYLAPSSVENYAVSGAVTRDLPDQAAKAKFAQYRLILIQIGGNDIIRFRSAEKGAEDLRAAIRALPEAERIIIISAGDVGGATLFPLAVRPFHTRLNHEYHDAFARVAAEEGVTYVNFGDAPATQIINNDPKTYLAADGLHPSSAGYALWFDTIQPSL